MKIIGNILGDMSGQLGKKIVAFTWKGIDVFRSYVIPTNPRSPDQTTQRNLFSTVVKIAQGCLTTVVHPYWKAFAIKQSNYNAFVSANMDVLSLPIDPSKLIMSKGSLFPAKIDACTYNDTTGAVVLGYSDELGSNGSASDDVSGFVFNNTTFETFAIATTERNAGTQSGNIATGMNVADLSAYTVVSADLGTSYEKISDSSFLAVSEP